MLQDPFYQLPETFRAKLSMELERGAASDLAKAMCPKRLLWPLYIFISEILLKAVDETAHDKPVCTQEASLLKDLKLTCLSPWAIGHQWPNSGMSPIKQVHMFQGGCPCTAQV